MRIFENKKGMAQTMDIAGVVTKVVDRPASVESKLVRAVGVIAVTLLVVGWLGSQLGISAASLQAGLTAHNLAMWLTIGVIIIFGSVLVRIGYDIILGNKQTSAFKAAKLEISVSLIAFVLFVIINAGWLSSVGLTIVTP